MKQEPSTCLEVLQETWQLTLQGEPVLLCRLTQPQLTGRGRGIRAINRYYRCVAEGWKRRWNRVLYLQACLDLADHAAAGHRFQPWQAQVDTCVTVERDDVLSLWQEGREQAGGQPPFVVPRGDTWNLKTGAPIPLSSFFKPGRRWQKKVLGQLEQQAEQRLKQGDSLLFQACPTLVKMQFDPARFWLEEDGLRIFYPPEMLGSRIEGTIVFPIPIPGQE